MSDKLDDLAIDVIKDFERRNGERGVWEDYWEEIAQLVEPTMRHSLRAGDKATPGERRFDSQMDSEPTRALSKFAAIMDSLLTPKGSIWHRLVPSDRNLLNDRDVKLYFEALNTTLFQQRYAPLANFPSQNQLVYRGLGSFGSAGMFIDKLDKGRGLRYKSVHIGQLYWKENHQGIVDDVIRRFELTAEQFINVPMWRDKITDDIARKAEKNPSEKYEILHRVRTRQVVDEEALDHTAMPFESVYVCKNKKMTLHEGGYRSFPYAATRYEQAPDEVYGRSPAMQVFASIRSLQVEKRAVLKSAHRNVDPVLLVGDDGLAQNVSLRPGAVVPGGVTADGRPLVQPLPAGNPNIGLDLMQQEKADIQDAFLIRLFQILQENPRMTATEVLERAREKGMLLAPTVGRQESEYLGPLISREIEVLNQLGLLPPMPEALIEAEGEYTIVYDSPLSKVARAEEAAGLHRTFETVLPIVNVTQDPSVLDNFNFDVITRDLSDIQAVPASWMRAQEEVAQLREQRQQAQERAMAAQEAPAQASLIQAAAAGKKAGLTKEDME